MTYSVSHMEVLLINYLDSKSDSVRLLCHTLYTDPGDTDAK